jgi:hypothetical protein
MFGTLIGSVTVGAGGTASIDFTSIPNTYTDLALLFSVRSDGSGSQSSFFIRFNGDAGATNHSYRNFYGTSSSAVSTNSTGAGMSTGWGDYAADTTNVFSSGVAYIPNYAGSTTKIASIEFFSEGTSGTQTVTAGAWTGTAALTAIKIYAAAGNLVQNSTAYLYGITKGTGGATAA